MVGRSTLRLPPLAMQPAFQPALRRVARPLGQPLFALGLTAEVSRFPPIVLCAVGCVCLAEHKLDWPSRAAHVSRRLFAAAKVVLRLHLDGGSGVSCTTARKGLPSFSPPHFHAPIHSSPQGRLRNFERLQALGWHSDSVVIARMAARCRRSGSATLRRCFCPDTTRKKTELPRGGLADVPRPCWQRTGSDDTVPRSG